MNVVHLDYLLSTSTWLTFATLMLTVQTPMDLITAHAWLDILEMEEFVTVGYI